MSGYHCKLNTNNSVKGCFLPEAEKYDMLQEKVSCRAKLHSTVLAKIGRCAQFMEFAQIQWLSFTYILVEVILSGKALLF